jgi:pimeloyl-ACP methyl ester carboxylesterase
VSLSSVNSNGSTLTCPFHAEPVTFAEAMRRFENEAVHGTCDTGRYLCHYFKWGSGPTLVCVPGLADDAQCFVMLMAHLSRHFSCLVYDWPTGETDHACLSHYRHADLVADLLALLDHVGARQAFPLGYSFGSTIALAAMHAQPDRFPRTVLLSGFARRRLAPAEYLLASLARYWHGPLHRLPLRQWVLHTNHHREFAQHPSEVWDHYIQRTGSLPMPALARRSLILHRVDLRSLLPRIRQQVLLICGDCDPLVNKQCEAELLTGLPNVARVELAHCGHLAVFTHSELLAEVAAEFIAAGIPNQLSCRSDKNV